VQQAKTCQASKGMSGFSKQHFEVKKAEKHTCIKMFKIQMRLPGVEPGSIAWKAIILTVGLQTPTNDHVL
jgi:hypothetical protein